MTTYTVGYIVGSLATASINRKLAKALVRLAPTSLAFTEIVFKDLPLYSYDYDADFPQFARDFKQSLTEVDAVLFVTPEYNRSIPGALKNAIDWASRPRGTNSFTHKPSAVIGASTGAIGTAVAQQHLRSLLGFCNSPQMNAPEAYIHFTPGLVTDDGEVTVDSTRDFLAMYMQEFADFIERVYTVLPRQRQDPAESDREGIMGDTIVWADIPVRDIKRASAFYAAVIGAPVMPMPGSEDSIALLMSPDGTGGVSADLYVGGTPSKDGPTVYLNTWGDIDAAVDRVVPAGGTVLQGKAFMGPMVGWIAFIEDTEGNRIGLQQPADEKRS